MIFARLDLIVGGSTSSRRYRTGRGFWEDLAGQRMSAFFEMVLYVFDILHHLQVSGLIRTRALLPKVNCSCCRIGKLTTYNKNL